MFFPQTLRTTRLVLRAPHAGDGPEMYQRFASDPEVARHLEAPPHLSEAESRQFISACMTAWVRAQNWTWMISLRNEPSPIGYVQFERRGTSIELGFALERPLWGRGYMPEAVRQVVALAFEDPNVHRIGALCEVNHWASMRVLEKAGMSQEGMLRKLLPRLGRDPADAYSYARVRGRAPMWPQPVISERLLGHSAL